MRDSTTATFSTTGMLVQTSTNGRDNHDHEPPTALDNRNSCSPLDDLAQRPSAQETTTSRRLESTGDKKTFGEQALQKDDASGIEMSDCSQLQPVGRELQPSQQASHNHPNEPDQLSAPLEDESCQEALTKEILRAQEPMVTSTQRRPMTTGKRIDVRLLVRRREAGALIGKRGANIKRMRDTYKSATFNIPDTGNGPERIVCIGATSWESIEAILLEIGQLFLDKSSIVHLGEEQVELKQLINSAYAGLLIGIGGQSIRKLRNDSRAAIKIYEMCCPLSDERVCAIKARPPVVVSTIRLIHEMMLANQATIKAPLQASKPYDALNFDLNLVDKYGGYVPDDCCPSELMDQQLRTSRVSGANGSCLANGLAKGLNPSQLQYHHGHQFHPAASNHQPLAHFDLMASGGGESLPLVMSPGFRTDAHFLAPFQQIDFALCHPIAAQSVNGRKLATTNQHQSSDRARFVHRSSPLPNNGHDQQQRPSSTMQTYRNQRFQPYSFNDSFQARLRFLQQQQQQQYNQRQHQLLFSSQLMDRISQQISQTIRPQMDYNNAAFKQQQARLAAFGPQHHQASISSPLTSCGSVGAASFRHHQQDDLSKAYQPPQLQSPTSECSCPVVNKNFLSAGCMDAPVLPNHTSLVKELGHLCRLNTTSSGDPRVGMDNHAHQDKSYYATQRPTMNGNNDTNHDEANATKGPI